MLFDISVDDRAVVLVLWLLQRAEDVHDDLEDQTGMPRGVSLLGGKGLEEGVEDVLKRFHQLVSVLRDDKVR